LQVLKEFNLALAEDEMRDFYRLVNQYSEFIEISWEPAAAEQVKFYEERGCRKGDAVIAAHATASGIKTIVSENRQFLQTLRDLSVEIVTAVEAQTRLAQLLS
jgi:predicted nucleic acid-binding protein